jgi:predicted ATPase
MNNFLISNLDNFSIFTNRTSPKRTVNHVRHLNAFDLLSLQEEQNNSGLPIQELIIDGLLSFGEMINLKFGKLNILVGPNGSGKSNLIDCLRLLRNSPLDIQQTFKDSGFEDWLYRGKNKSSGTATIEVIVNIPEFRESIRHQIKLGSVLNSRAQLEELISNKTVNNEPSNSYFIGSYRSQATLSAVSTGIKRHERSLGGEYDSFQSILSQIRDIRQYPEITRLAKFYDSFRIYSEWTFGRKSNLREATPANRSSTMLSESMNDLALALNGLENTPAHEKIRFLLQELKETYIDYSTRIFFGRVGLELIESPFDLPVPAQRLSDGTLRFLALAAILLQVEPPPLICLEEPELGMHPDMIRMVAQMIIDASKKTQLIVTTHSEQLLTTLQNDFDTLFAFDTGLEGSNIKSFTQEEYGAWRQEHTLGELWTSGELGGNRW